MTKKREYKHEVVMLLLLIAIAALGAVVLSSALFGQQHSWYDISQSGNDVPCSKCHGNIEVEFLDMPDGAPHKSKTCEFCHRNETGVTYAIGDGPSFQLGEEAHAASIPPCQQCHTPHITDIHSVNESHKPLVDTSDLNEACILCHTGFDKDLRFKRWDYIEFDILDTNPVTHGPPSNREKWELDNFTTGSISTTQTEFKPAGGKHTWLSKSDIDCFDCHSDVVDALEMGGHVPRSGYGEAPPAMKAGHQGMHHNFSRGADNVEISACEGCHLTNYSNFGKTPWPPNDVWFNHSGFAQLDYHAATTEQCLNCHKVGAQAAIDAGYGCYIMCHSIMCNNKTTGKPWNAQYGNWDPFRHKNLTANMESLPGWCDYKTDKVCVACHIADGDFAPLAFPNDNGRLHIRIYTEPDANVSYTYY